MPDAPDYTLLSDVNVVGSVTLDVNVVGSVTINTYITGVESGVTFNVAITSSTVTLDVNIANATVTLDVNVTNSVLNVQGDVNITNTELNIRITAQDVDVTIINPTGIPLYTGGLVQATKHYTNFGLDEEQSATIVSETGRGRLLSVSIFAYKVSGTTSAQPTSLKLRITVDGVVSEFSINELGIMAGTPTTPMGAGVTSAWVRSYKLSKLGGISAIHMDSNGYIDRVYAVFLLEFDYTSSLTVEIVNPSGSGGYFSGDAFAWVGGYP